jgi:hypothetical protein
MANSSAIRTEELTDALGASGVGVRFPDLAAIRRCFRFMAKYLALTDIPQVTTGRT